MYQFLTEKGHALQNKLKKLFVTPENRGKKIPNDQAKYMEEKFGLRFAYKPTVRVVERKSANENSRRDVGFVPRYSSRKDEIQINRQFLESKNDPLEPAAISLFEENGHAYFAQKRPDVKAKRLNIIDATLKNNGPFSEENARSIAEIMILDEGIANYLRRRVGSLWCQDNNLGPALKFLKFREIIDYNPMLRAAFALKLDTESKQKMIDEKLAQFSNEQIHELQKEAVKNDESVINDAVSGLTTNSADHLIESIDKLDFIGYRTGLFFVRSLIGRLQTAGFSELQAIQWVIDKGPFAIEDYFKPESIAIPTT